jgi:hypothetical protein
MHQCLSILKAPRRNSKNSPLDNYPGEDVSGFTAGAQKHVKVKQSGYALPIRVGSKLFTKVCKNGV